jgi:hypothetical protein
LGLLEPIASKKIQKTLLELSDQFSDVQAPTPEVQQRVDHQLAWTMVSDLSTTVGLDDRNGMGVEDMVGAGSKPQGKDRRMLHQPDLIRRVGLSMGGKGPHLSQAVQVGRLSPDATD